MGDRPHVRWKCGAFPAAERSAAQEAEARLMGDRRSEFLVSAGNAEHFPRLNGVRPKKRRRV
jgi:hypothetical protein